MPAATKSKKGSQKSGPDMDQLKEAFKAYVLTEGKEPSSVFHFTQSLGIEEEVFYSHFSSFRALQEAIWAGFVHETIEALNKDEVYGDYSNREKLLAFYYTFIERLLKDRSYIDFTFRFKIDKNEIASPYLKKFKEIFLDYVRELIRQGIKDEEIVKRPILSDRYKDALWMQLLFVIKFWLNDDSPNFEKTDAAIEKSVNLSFELMGNGPLDQIVDFARFLFQNRN